MLTRARELRGLKLWIVAHDDHDARANDLLGEIDVHLDAVEAAAEAKGERGLTRMLHGLTGASFERVLGNLDAAEVHLLRLAPSSVLIPALPSVEANVNRYLPKQDPRREALDRIATGYRERMLNEPKAILGPAGPTRSGTNSVS